MPQRSAPIDLSLGQLLETFVYQELRRQATPAHPVALTFSHFRDKDGAEVDVVIDRGAGALAGIEVKASAGTGHASRFSRLAQASGGSR